MAYTCTTCGVVADDPGHLCNPSVEKVDCSHCGTKDVGVHHVCKEMLAAVQYSCQSCGRVDTDGSSLCRPAKIG
jgi:uncharacterized Zn finger protein